MGLGDEIMASGHALTESERVGDKVHILDRFGQPRWHDLWEGLPWIAKPNERSQGFVRNAPFCRPYIQYPFTIGTGLTFSNWRARDHIGSICLRDEELEWGADKVGHLGKFILIEPTIPARSNPNKQWGMSRWSQLINLLNRSLSVVQPLMQDIRTMIGVAGVSCPSFRHACALVYLASECILPDGGLHHAAAALGKHATVLLGGYPSPEHLGYPFHTNIHANTYCGKWLPCQHCQQFWDDLSPEEVYQAASV